MNNPAAPYCAMTPSVDPEKFLAAIDHHLLTILGRDPSRAGKRDVYTALALAVRDILIKRWVETQRSYYDLHEKRVYYLSLEFLIGRSLINSIINLGLYDTVVQSLQKKGFDLDVIREEEIEAALGNGGLGRLAACLLESMATLGIPAYGYGIRYEYGLFYQRIVDGFQVEGPDNWLRCSTPWEFERPQYLFPVHYYGRVETAVNGYGEATKKWIDTEEVMAMACDYMVPGFNNQHVINMRLWTARATRELDLSWFNRGDYIAAIHDKVASETISKVLYPSDDIREGQELRLKQQYFFVAATIQDILRRYRKKHTSFEYLGKVVAIQLNDTHPVIGIPELMRVLVDDYQVGWDQAFAITRETFAYTNHTLMPEALETWPVELVQRLLPRHMEIIYEINARFLDEVRTKHGHLGPDAVARLSIIEEGPVKKVRMANLAIVGSHSVNGVARLHTDILKERVFADFHAIFPDRLNAKTNGITPRRWLLSSNPSLSGLITTTIGGSWVTDLDQLKQLADFADDPEFQNQWAEVKLHNKRKLADRINQLCGVTIEPASLFDVHIKRIHEYKRQLLNILQVIIRYQRMKDDPSYRPPSRTVIFAGKAAPSYDIAKLIIKLIHAVAGVVNNDPDTREFLQVVFLPNYNVSLAEQIIPAADLSEQISTAGTEASGTGNMKLALNGALTIGTLDGANIEIMEEVGRENMYIFGMTSDEAEQERRSPAMPPQVIYAANGSIRRAVDAVATGFFAPDAPDLFGPLVSRILAPVDPYLVLADMEAYIACQEQVDRDYVNKDLWIRKTIITVSGMGYFSSDRTVREYARDIWDVPVDGT